MLNIAPLDYERYAALYSPPPLTLVASNDHAVVSKKAIEEAGPIRSELGRRGSTFSNKVGKSVSLQPETFRVTDDNDSEHPLNGPFPKDLLAYFEPANSSPNTPQAQLGITPDKVAALYEHQTEPAQGTLRTVA